MFAGCLTTKLFLKHLLASKHPELVAMAKERDLVQFRELVAIRRRIESTNSAALFASIENYVGKLDKQKHGWIFQRLTVCVDVVKCENLYSVSLILRSDGCLH